MFSQLVPLGQCSYLLVGFRPIKKSRYVGSMSWPALFRRVRDETKEMPCETGAWSRKGGRQI